MVNDPKVYVPAELGVSAARAIVPVELMGPPLRPNPVQMQVTALPFDTEVSWPWAFTVKSALVYDPGVTPVLESATVPVEVIGPPVRPSPCQPVRQKCYWLLL